MSTATNSSSSSNDKQDANRELPVVDGLHEPFETPYLTTAADKGQAAIQRHAATIRKLKEQERDIAEQHEKLQDMIDALESRRQEYMELEFNHALASRKRDSPTTPNVPTETPGPHRLQPKAERPEDLAYKTKQAEQQQAEQAQAAQTEAHTDNLTAASPEQALLNVFSSLTQVLKDNNKHLHSSDISEPTKFDGTDSHWDDWYLQLRTYLEAKGWLATFEHPTGPGTAGFDLEINKKIYNKLLALCRKGTAATYVTKAANFNGWEAARCLIDRYEGYSKQRQRSLRQLIEQLRHVHGTNMSRHIDRFERICGLMAHNNPTKPPTDEKKIDWFLESVTEKTYDSVHTTCTDKLLDGDLTFAKVIKLYTHRCFQRYPTFNWTT